MSKEEQSILNSLEQTNLESLRKITEDEIQSRLISGKPAPLYDAVRYIMDLGGKRIRPLLVFAAYRTFSTAPSKNVATLAIAVEWFHNFTLMHDDIMDRADMRRGHATVHKKWDTATAILSGDLMLIQVYGLLAELEQPELLSRFNQMASQLCEGQMLDMEFEKAEQVSNEEYLQMIEGKTAVLLGFCLLAGGTMASCSDKQKALLYQLGIDLGMAFQLMDDYLDSFGEQAKVGKRIGGDILEQKKTFLWNAMYSNLGEDELETLHQKYKQGNDQEIIGHVKDLMIKTGAAEQTHAKAAYYEAEAAKGLEALKISGGNTETLSQLFQQLSGRTY